MYKISVICPVYNCEDVIDRTINSIINQTVGFENIELILVDDCSTDSSTEIIEKYCLKYDNIRLFKSKINHGLPGYGRNVGVEKSNADYVMFIDNDDEYCPDFCKLALDAINRFNCDVVSFNHLFLNNGKIRKEDTFSRVNVRDENNFKLISLDEIYYFQVPFIWTKIFKKSIIVDNNIKFVEDIMNEDMIFLYDFYYYADSLVYANYYGYKWHREGDNLSNYSIKSTLGIIESSYDVCRLIGEKYGDVDSAEIFIDSIEASIIRICMSFRNISEIKHLSQELYAFEEHINFNKKMNHIWSKTINYFIRRKIFSVSTILIYLLRKVKMAYDALF